MGFGGGRAGAGGAADRALITLDGAEMTFADDCKPDMVYAYANAQISTAETEFGAGGQVQAVRQISLDSDKIAEIE